MWARLSTLEKGRPIWIPLRSHPNFDQRAGFRAGTLQINQTEHGLRFGVLTDVTDALARSREAYAPRMATLAIDLGLRTLLTTSEGDLMGRDWMDRLQRIDGKLTKLTRHRQAIGLKKVRSNRYRRYVEHLRGTIRTEVGRMLNRLVAKRAPATIVVEHLRFQSPGLSKRMNRLLSWFGTSAIEAKLQSLSDTFGIAIDTIHAAYSSQECDSCGYVDKKNRPSQAVFACGWCGHQRQADVNAARVLKHRRSVLGFSDTGRHRHAILDLLASTPSDLPGFGPSLTIRDGPTPTSRIGSSDA